jgi:hypothetical protein
MKQTAIILCLFAHLSLSGQSEWFRFSNGWKAFGSFLEEDTIISFCQGAKGFDNLIIVNRHHLSSGDLIRSDTFDYMMLTGDSIFSSQFNTNTSFTVNPYTGGFDLGFSYLEKVKGAYRWRAGVFHEKSFKKWPAELSMDTFDSHLMTLHRINGTSYAIVTWIVSYGPLNGKNNWRVVRFKNDSSFNVIRQQVQPNCQGCRQTSFEKVYKDMLDSNSLLLETTDYGDYYGSPNSWQTEIIRLDTTGKVVWVSRPNNNDSFNTASFQMIQKPDGNFICSWNTIYYAPHKQPGHNTPYAEVNDQATIWFAEIDRNNGKILWRKNIQEYFNMHMSKSDIPGKYDPNDLDIFKVSVTRDGKYLLWSGHRSRTYQYFLSWKRLAVVFKTDLMLNPIWYREYEFYPGDYGDKGMWVLNHVEATDGSILVSGEYDNWNGQASGGEFWQKATLLKLDSFGCLDKGCNLTSLSPFEYKLHLIQVYPNPTEGRFSIVYPEGIQVSSIQLINSEGKCVQVLDPGSSDHKLSENLHAGLYLLEIGTSNGVFHVKIILE